MEKRYKKRRESGARSKSKREREREKLPSFGGVAGRVRGPREVKCSGVYAVRLPRDYIPSIAIMRGVS